MNSVLLIAGAARSGTTALARTLEADGRFHVLEPKEPHFLALGDDAAFVGPGDDWTIESSRVKTREEYLALHSRGPESACNVDGSVTTLLHYSRSIASALETFSCPIYVAVLLRQPSERAYSNYLYNCSKGLETLGFREAVCAEGERATLGWGHLWRYYSLGLYSQGLYALHEAFPGRVLVLDYEEFSESPARGLGELVDMLGWSSPISPLEGRVNVSGVPRGGVRGWVARAMQLKWIRLLGRRSVPRALRERVRVGVMRPTELPRADRTWLDDMYKSEFDSLRRMGLSSRLSWLDD